MKIKIIASLIVILAILKAEAQDEGTLHLGIFGRSESNLYKYQANTSGSFTSIRNSTGYSVGIAADYIPFYMVKFDTRISFSETNFAPAYKYNQGTLHNANMRLSQMAINAHFIMGSKNSKVFTTLFLGQQFNHILDVNISADGEAATQAWPVNRLFTQMGLTANVILAKQKLLIKPEVGLRFNALGVKRDWENNPNQIFGGLTLSWRIKS